LRANWHRNGDISGAVHAVILRRVGGVLGKALAVYMNEVLATEDPAFIADALGIVARARGMSEAARLSGLSRESLYRALSPEGNTEFATILRVVRAMGLRLTTTSIDERKIA